MEKGYSTAAVERAMNVQEVILRAMSGQLLWSHGRGRLVRKNHNEELLNVLDRADRTLGRFTELSKFVRGEEVVRLDRCKLQNHLGATRIDECRRDCLIPKFQ